MDALPLTWIIVSRIRSSVLPNSLDESCQRVTEAALSPIRLNLWCSFHDGGTSKSSCCAQPSTESNVLLDGKPDCMHSKA